ncbi:RNase E specificity factor CsrD [Vibrio aerogenes CECT 7868]|uniref:RNase E specificity factor CsrD n=1 Tax=Vibrio aerogenes CECT 7868 TaxID=1216006 RepID=A0A1M5YMP7_9VIBR|nr:RNase E specificity factor CsrD [Vibrio aerogenes]SHI13282.1 RNase E specificity factor CsrD [Vibrio aerogenes CECT 7868]
MRYTPTIKLSTRLVAFVTMIVTCAMFILFVGGSLSFQQLGRQYLNHYLNGIVDVIDQEMETADSTEAMKHWLPKLLQASNIVEMKLNSKAGTLYHFQSTKQQYIDEERFYLIDLPLKRNQGYTLHFKILPPYVGFTYSFSAMWSTTLAIVLIIFCLIRGVRWLQAQLLGSELLEERGRMILAGQVERFAKGDSREWPYTVSEALDRLIEELRDARQERSRFDTFIRTQTFLDQLTGTANRVLFDNKLESSLLEGGASGGLLMICIEDLDEATEENDKTDVDALIVNVGECISNIIQRYPDGILSRYYESVFVVLIPHQGPKEVSSVAVQCLKAINKIVPPAPMDKSNWCHMGISMYSEGDRRGRILDEAEIAVKSARLEEVNAWSSFHKDKSDDNELSNVRWRTLFEKYLNPDKIHLFAQDCYLTENTGQPRSIHKEIFVRIPENGRYIKFSRFSSAIVNIGFESVLDRLVCQCMVRYLARQKDDSQVYSINLYVIPFSNQRYFKWFRYLLLGLTQKQRARLCFEFNESQLVRHLDYMRPVIRMISGFGCKVIVSEAGRMIVSTHYIKDLKVDYLKLHRSLVKKVEHRHENQLFVRSMLGVCRGSETKVIAVGVESEEEWEILKSLGIHGAQGRLFAQEKQLIPPPQPDIKVKPGKRKRWKTSSVAHHK